MRCWLGVIALSVVAGCGGDVVVDAGGLDAARPDAGTGDAGPEEDAGPPRDAGPFEPCDTPGAIEMRPCGACGTASRFCTAGGFWMEEPCADETGECVPGSTEDGPCGNCGTVTRRCTTECVWDASAACRDEGECAPGSALSTEDGCPAGERRGLVCNDECVLEEVSACAVPGCGTPGVTETVSCGTRCGSQTRFCDVDGVWEYDPCVETGACVPGSSSSIDCGACGMQPARCNVDCEWMAVGGACTGTGTCSPGDERLVSTGCMPHEAQSARCDATCGFALDGMCGPLVSGLWVAIPHRSPPEPGAVTFGAATTVPSPADLYFLFDATGSMGGEISALRDAVSSIVDDRGCTDSGVACSSDATCGADERCAAGGTCVEDPSATGCITDLWTGAGIYRAFYENRASLQPDPETTRMALEVTPSGSVEELYEALLALADPDAVADEVGCAAPMADRVGCPAFRASAQRVAFVFTDEDSDGFVTATAAGAALASAGITLVGVWTGPSTTAAARDDLVDVVRESGSLHLDGTPLVFDGADAAVVPAVTAALDEVLIAGSVRVTARVVDGMGDAVDVTRFVARLQVNVTDAGCATGATEDTDGDGLHDTFTSLAPGARACFDLVPLQNDVLAARESPQVFEGAVEIYGDGVLLDRQTVSFIVPSDP